MSLTLCIAIIDLALIAIGIELTIWIPDTPTKKRVFRGLFIMLAIALLILTIFQQRQDEAGKSAITSQLSIVTVQLKQQKGDFYQAENQYKDVIRIMANSTQPIKAALDALSDSSNFQATNDYFNPKHLDDLLLNAQASVNQKRSEAVLHLAPVSYSNRIKTSSGVFYLMGA